MIRSGSGIGKITVRKSDLLAVLADNAKAHSSIYAQAVEAYRAKAIAALDKLIADVRDGAVVRLSVWNLPVPEDHSADYSRAINMLQMHQGDSIELDEEAYSRLVDDEWEWRGSWLGNTMAYAKGEVE